MYVYICCVCDVCMYALPAVTGPCTLDHFQRHRFVAVVNRCTVRGSRHGLRSPLFSLSANAYVAILIRWTNIHTNTHTRTLKHSAHKFVLGPQQRRCRERAPRLLFAFQNHWPLLRCARICMCLCCVCVCVDVSALLCTRAHRVVCPPRA